MLIRHIHIPTLHKIICQTFYILSLLWLFNKRYLIFHNIIISHGLVGIDKLKSAISGEHVDDDNLSPFFDINEEVAEFPVVLVNQIDSLRAHFLEGLNCTSSHELFERSNKFVVIIIFNLTDT